MTTHAGLVGSYNYPLVALSVFIAILAAYAALDLAGRVTTAYGVKKLAWIGGGAVAMGSGIWAMHYVGMYAFRLPVPVWYDWPTVLLSLFAAILASGIALYTVSRPTVSLLRMFISALFMGSGIAGMHYIGMYAMRLPAMCVYSPWLVLLSIVIAIVVSFIALQQAFRFRETTTAGGWQKLGTAVLMGLAIPTMHYVGMAAVHFVPMPSVMDHDSVDVSRLGLAGIVLITLVLLAIVFVSSAMDRQVFGQTQQFEDNLAQLRAVFDSMTDAIVVADFDKDTIEHNRAAGTLLGLTKKVSSLQDIADNFEGFLPTGAPLAPEEWPLMRAAHGDYCTNTAIVIRRKDTGQTATTEITSVPMTSAGKRGRKVILSIRDIGERMLLDETRTRMAAIVESSEDAIIGKNYDGIVTSWNRGAEKIFGYSTVEMMGQPIMRLLPPDRAHEETEILARLRSGEVVDHFQTVRVRKDGTHINVSLTISPILDASGNVIGASKIARDITGRMKLERQLQQSQKMDAIGQLTGGVAHDFNNLLGIVIGNLDLLERQVSTDAAALQRVQTAQKAALRGADLTRRLLAFSSNETLSPEPTNVHHLIRNVIEMTQRVIGPEIKVATSFDESISQIVIDAASLESALVNLMVNARDAMPKGGSITISTQLTKLDSSYPPVHAGELKAGPYACVSVSDTGQGMSKQTLERVFEPFFTTKPRGKGTGLGLAMVYGFVKQSHGTVRVYSEQGYGTTVNLYLPVTEDASSPLAEVVESRSSFNESATVLVVDDETDLLDIAKAYLEIMGCKAFTAVDGNDALHIVQREKNIDLMVTDIIMPGGMNGVELAAKVRELDPKIKIIYCSGFPADALAERSMPLIDGPLLHKPYLRDDFSALVRRVLENGNANSAASKAGPLT